MEAFKSRWAARPPGADGGGIPDAPPPGAFVSPSSFPGLPGLGAPRLPGLGGGAPVGLNPFGGKEEMNCEAVAPLPRAAQSGARVGRGAARAFKG